MENNFRISEQEDFRDEDSNYPLMDLYYAFFKIYKKWVEDRFGLEVDNYPMSYLIEKYKRNFYEEVMDEKFDSEDDVPNIDRWSVGKIVKKLIQKNKVNIPSLRASEKFTEKYKNQIPFFIKRLDLPDFISVSIIEDKPYELNVRVSYDFDKVVKQENYLNSPSTYSSKLRSYLEKYLGMRVGEPRHGDVDYNYARDPIFNNLDSWLKTVLNGVIKKKIKQLDTKGVVRNVRFTPSISKSEMKIGFKSDTPYGERNTLRNQVKDYLQKEGYNNIRVEVTY